MTTPASSPQKAGAPPMATETPKKTLVLHIAVPGVYADDLDCSARELASAMGRTEPTASDYLDVVTEEWMREEVGITIVTLPGEKNLNEDFEVHAYKGRVVGAEVRDSENTNAT